MAIQFLETFPGRLIRFSVEPTLKRLVTFGGVTYTEYWIDQDCATTVSGMASIECAVWLCGGGGSGYTAYTYPGCGGGGGYTATYAGPLESGAITIGLGGPRIILDVNSASGEGDGGATILSMPGLGTLQANGGARGGSSTAGAGGSGGGRSRYNGGTIGPGQGTTTVPFGDTTNHIRYCAGGGAGAYKTASEIWDRSAGGGNGGNGGIPTRTATTTGNAVGGIGGNVGGGAGGSASAARGYDGSDATHYGGGGGGGGRSAVSGASPTTGAGGAGYKGVVIVRVPV